MENGVLTKCLKIFFLVNQEKKIWPKLASWPSLILLVSWFLARKKDLAKISQPVKSDLISKLILARKKNLAKIS